MDGYNDPRLMTNVLRLEYDYIARTARLHQSPSCCTDMSGVIELFTHIHPDVERIETYAGGKPDTFYTLAGGGWSATPPRK